MAERDPIIGQTIGSYRVAEVIGQGGMGRVYAAVHPSIGSRVAVKVLSHECAQKPDAVRRFFDEARVVNRIRHDGIVQVLDLDSLPDGRPYIVMELLSGRTLTRILEQTGPMEPAAMMQLVAPLLDALAAAHQCGVIHRDLKPDNVLVTDQGRVVILDFGIAKLLPEDGQPAATSTRSMIGTPSFMAPEQIQGIPASPATDVYAVGLIVYRMLTGTLPFAANSLFELLQAHVSQAPIPMQSHRPQLPQAFDQVVLRALAKDPGQRFANAAHLQLALVQAAHGTAPPLPQPRRSRAGIGLAIAGLTVAAAAVVIGVLTTRTGENASTSPADAAVPIATASASLDAAPVPDAAAAIASQAPPKPSQSAKPPAARPPTHKKPTKKQAVTDFGGVTIVSTSKLAEQMTGIDPVFVPLKLTDFDAVAFVPRARKLAQRLMPDAKLTYMEIDQLRWDGVALLRKESGATYRFRSQARSRRPPGVMANEEVDIPCMVYVEVTRAGMTAGPVTDEECKQRFLPDPTCHGAHLWRRAFPKGPPPGAKDYAAEADYDGTWWLSIDGLTVDGEDDFSTDFSDNC